ncbi:MAG: hypothetical protein HW416_2499 [Chloroflexi bacterium]|nr:hypothetical protein [Chloroflexota bacterium]
MAAFRSPRVAQALVAWNETRQTPLVERGRIARSMWSRGKGLLGTHLLAQGDGLLIDPCQSIHSFGMQYLFDAIFLTRQGKVVHLISEMKPARMSRHVFSSRSVLELPAGTIRASGTQHGDIVRWKLEPPRPTAV